MKRQERVNRGRRSRPAGRTGARPQSRTARGDGGQNAARFSNSGTATDARTQRAPRRRVAWRPRQAAPQAAARQGAGAWRGGPRETPQMRVAANTPRSGPSQKFRVVRNVVHHRRRNEPFRAGAKRTRCEDAGATRNGAETLAEKGRAQGEMHPPPPPPPVRVGADEDALHPGLSALRGDRLT